MSSLFESLAGMASPVAAVSSSPSSAAVQDGPRSADRGALDGCPVGTPYYYQLFGL